MKKMKFYLMTLVAVAMMAVSCERPVPPVPPTPQVNEVELTNAYVVYFQDYNNGDFEHYVLMFEDKANEKTSYYAEVISYVNDKKAPTPGKYNLNAAPEAIAGDILLVLEKTIIVGTDTTALEADSVVMEIKENEVVINAKYPEGTVEKLVYNNALPAALDFPGSGEPTEVQDFNWTANAAIIQVDTALLGQFTLLLADTITNQGAQIVGFAGYTWGTMANEGLSFENFEFATGTYPGLSMNDFLINYYNQGNLINFVITTNYSDYANWGDEMSTLIVNNEDMYWTSTAALLFEGDLENAKLTFEAESYYGSFFRITYEGELTQFLYASQTMAQAPRKLAPKAEQYWGNSLIVKQPRYKKPVVKLAKFIR